MLEQRGKITRNLPMKVICPSTRHRVINQIIYEEFIIALWSKCSNWTKSAHDRLLKYGIDLSEGVLKSYKLQIKNGERDPISASKFGSSLFDEDYTTRYGKDAMYKQFEIWRQFFITQDNPKYIGLPANQILSVIHDFGADNVFACESNKSMFLFMQELQRHFSKQHATIKQCNILEYLNKTDKKFSIFDFDLMCQANNSKLIERLIYGIQKSVEFPAVINIVTTVGRWITEIEYKDLMPQVIIKGLEEHGIIIVNSYSGGYNDRIIPMRYEFIAIDRKRNG